MNFEVNDFETRSISRFRRITRAVTLLSPTLIPHMNRNICLFVMCLAFFACTSSKGVYVRVKNESNHDVSNVSILWEDKKDELYIEHIRSGETTKYYPVEVAYRYGRIEMTIDGERALLQPEDYVGEEPLDPGRYSYILSIDPNAADIYSRITIKCVKDAR